MPLNHKLCLELAEYVEELTTSGEDKLDEGILKKLKKICKQSDDYLKRTFDLLLNQLNKDHAEIRYSTFLLTDELFNRSHYFRQLLLDDFQSFMELTLEIDHNLPLPPPKSVAKQLKCKSQEAIQKWHEKYGQAYKKLELGYNFLKHCKKVDFEDIQSRSLVERRRAEEERDRRQAVLEETLRRTLAEMNDMAEEIKDVLLESQNCLDLLLPEPELLSFHDAMSPDPHRNPAWFNTNTPSTSYTIPTAILPTSPTTSTSYTIPAAILPTSPTTSTSYTIPTAIMPTSPPTSTSYTIPAAILPTSPTTADGLPSTSSDQWQPGSGSELASPSSMASSKRSLSESSDVEGQSYLISEQVNRTFTNACYRSHSHSSDFVNRDGHRTDHPSPVSPNDSHRHSRDHPSPVSPNDSHRHSRDHPSPVSPNDMHKHKTDHQSPTSPNDMHRHKTDHQSPTSPNDRHRHRIDHQSPTSPNDSSSEESEDEFEEVSDIESEASFVRQLGLGSQTYSLSIQLPSDSITITETTDNTDILRTLKDQLHLVVNRFLPAVRRWLQVLGKTEGTEVHLRKAIDMKRSLEALKMKADKLQISPMSSKTTRLLKGGDNDDFEEVPAKDGYEARSLTPVNEGSQETEKPVKPSTSRDWQFPKKHTIAMDLEEKDPTSSVSTLRKLEQTLIKSHSYPGTSKPSTVTGPQPDTHQKNQKGDNKRKEKLLKRAPVVPYSTDLYHWGQNDKHKPLLVTFDVDHRFWQPINGEGVDQVDKGAELSMKSRVINFVGQYERVKWKCRAPMPNGKLCDRMDRLKCPFHGRIVPRDDSGKPTNARDLEKLAQQSQDQQQANFRRITRSRRPMFTTKQRMCGVCLSGHAHSRPCTCGRQTLHERIPEWQDPELLADIQAATGIDLSNKRKGKGKKGKGKRKRHPKLTDIKTIGNSSRKRLESKVFKKASLQRVAEAMNAIDAKKYNDKFSNQFHYAFKR